MSGDPGAMPRRDRAMGERVLREARARGIEDRGEGVLARAVDLAMVPRRDGLADDHHPAYLHPGRTVLILLQDTPERDPLLLAAAALLESDHTSLRVGSETIQQFVGQEVAGLVVQVSGPSVDGGPLLEALLDLPTPLARVALAERLDHLRHLHLAEDPPRRRRMYREAVEIYAPLAPRVDPVLARRYDWWCRMFARRHLPADGG